MDYVVMIIIGLLVLVSTIAKRVMQAAAEGEHRGEPEDREFRAPRGKVREFLEEVQRSRQETAVPVQEVPPAPAETPRRVTLPPPLPAPAPQARPRAARRVAKRPRELRARERPIPPAQPPAPTAGPVVPTAVRLADTDLKKAVVWAEILGRPVSMRRRRGHEPPTFQP